MPRRRCVGCGRVAPKPELVRLAAVLGAPGRGASAVLDRAGTMPGRGAYVCRVGAGDWPSPECVRLATRRDGLRRALRRPVELSAELLDAVSLESDTRVAQPDTSPASRAPRDLVDR